MIEELNLNENKLIKEVPKKAAKKFRLTGKNFFLTYPQCFLEKQDVLDLLMAKVGIDYGLVAREFHEDGNPHIHAFLTLKKKFDTRSANFFDLGNYHGNYQVARCSDDVIDYCNKADKEPLTYGVYVGNNQSVVQKRALQNKMILSKPLPQLVDEGVIHISMYKKMKDAISSYKLDKVHVPDYMPKTCYWIYGPTGCGKSRYVRDNHPNSCYFKPQNKWWDGYDGEKVVLIDDFDMQGACLGHHLKIWGDCYSFVAEVKGTTVRPVFDTFYITSQYLPKDIWCSGTDPTKWDTELMLAIQRRFKIVTPVDGELSEFIG